MFQTFQRKMLINYIIGSFIAVFGVGSMFIFHTLHLSSVEMGYLLIIMTVSVTIMLYSEFLLYHKHATPIRKVFFKQQRATEAELQLAYRTAHRFPVLTVQRILGPHLLGFSVPASLLAIVLIILGVVNLPLYYIGLAWCGAVLIALMHAMIEFFLTYRSIRPILQYLTTESQRNYGITLSIDQRNQLSMRAKLLGSAVFTALFPVLLFVLASQIRFAENGNQMLSNYWSWASLIVSVVLIVSLAGAILLFKNIQHPIEELQERFDNVYQGHFESMENLYDDEFSHLVNGFNHMVAGIKERDEKNDKLIESFFTVFAATLDARDPYTAGHSERVADYSVRIAKRAGFSSDQIEMLRKSALLHDIGKIGVRDHVLLKEGKLTEEEFSKIQEHPVIGYNILQQVGLPKDLLPVLPGVRSHHERFDGKGYPDQLSGENIPVFGRLMAVADAYDAMTSDRPYRKGMPEEKALTIIEEGSGTQWDPYFASLFLEEMNSSVSIREIAASKD
ncbi:MULTISPECIES: HD domain-containing phosphohydrolase [Pontibacillus]|uniref:HD domain-containing phosphohydrolase n=1 Tax=Pontibacillus TaxID=289201 RepID=UPI00339C140C